MKRRQFGLLFLLILLVPRKAFSAINLTISDLSPKDDHYQVTAVVTGMSSSSGTFIQGVFTPKDASKYFGYTFSKKGEWLKYESTPDKNFVLENYIQLQNDQPVTIFLKPDYDDKDYAGPGKYLVKLKRFTASGSPSDYSNSLDLDLSFALTTPHPTTINTPTSTIQNLKSTISLTPTPTSPPKTPTSISKTNTITSTITATPPSTTSMIYDQKTTISISPQVLSTTSSDIYLATNSTHASANFEYELNLATSSAQTVSDKTLFVIGASIFSLSGSLLYFRLKNL